MDLTRDLLYGHDIYPRSGASNPNTVTRPPVYKAVGISLAIAAGLFIGVSFVLKKIGLLKANVKYNEEAGEGYGYLKNHWWWTGMTLMIIGELCNFAAYAFVDAILVTPLGALSVVITTILSAIFLKERLSFVGKVGCFICIVGSVVIVINAPAQSSAATIQQMQHFVIAPGFLTYAGVVIVACVFTALWAGPRYGKKSMLVYLSICSLIGGLSVVATQGLGAAVVAQAGGTPQFNQWFLYVLLAFVVSTLVTEIIYLNKALNIYNAALVTPTYYVFFTSATIVTSAILFRGFKGTPGSITTVVMGFLQICSGVVLLQLSKSAKDVPDAAVFTGDLDQVRTVAEQQQPEFEPKADAIRGTAALIRRFSVSRQKMEVEEAKRLHEEQLRDLEPIRENEQFEWDGLRRRRTTSGGSGNPGSLRRKKTIHPPLGMSYFSSDLEDREQGGNSRGGHEEEEDGGMFDNIRRKARSAWLPGQAKNLGGGMPDTRSPIYPVQLTDVPLPAYNSEEGPTLAQSSHRLQLASDAYPSTSFGQELHEYSSGYRIRDGETQPHQSTPIKWAPDVGSERTRSPSTPPKPPPHMAKRQFSFQNVFHRNRDNQTYEGAADDLPRPRSRLGVGSRRSSLAEASSKPGTEEERLGLVQGDSRGVLPLPELSSEDEDWRLEGKLPIAHPEGNTLPHVAEKEQAIFDSEGRRWSNVSSSSAEHPSSSSVADESHWDRESRIGKSGKGAFM